MDPILSYFIYIPLALKILRAVVPSEGEVEEEARELSRAGNGLFVEGSRGGCQNSSSYTL